MSDQPSLWGAANSSLENPNPFSTSLWGAANSTLNDPLAANAYWGIRNVFGVTSVAPSGTLVPPSGAWFGGSYAKIGTFADNPTEGLASWVTAIGQRPHIIGIYKTGTWNGAFSNAELNWFDPVGGKHAIPHLRMKFNAGGSSWAGVAAGDRDADIDTFSTNIKKYPHKLFLSIYHEPEDNIGDMAGMTPADYVAMWQHVRNRMESVNGVTNVVWTICYMGYSGWAVNSAGKGFNDMYPGDDVIDWISWDPYTGTSTTTLAKLVNENIAGVSGWTGFYNWATTNHPSKPLMLAEFGYGITTTGSGMTIAQSAAMIAAHGSDAENFPAIKAYEQWHAVGTRDYQQSPYPASVTALQGVLASPWFTQDPDLAP